MVAGRKLPEASQNASHGRHRCSKTLRVMTAGRLPSGGQAAPKEVIDISRW